VALRRLKVDGVDAHADLLDQLQRRRAFDVRRLYRPQNMQQGGRLAHRRRERRIVAFVDDGKRHPRQQRRLKLGAKAIARAIMQNDFHRRTWAGKPLHPANVALSPISSSMRNNSFHFAMRSDRAKDPTLNCPESQPVERCAMLTSSVSPDRAETMAAHPASCAARNAANPRETVPAWFTLMRAQLHAPASAARFTRAASVTRKSSPTICTLPPIAAV